MQPRVPVTFVPAGSTVWVTAGETVADAARAASVLISAPCAGRGVCAGCGIRVLSGDLEPPDDVERQALRRAPKGIRLACRARVTGPVEVRPLFSAPDVEGGSAPVRPPVGAAALVAGIDLGTTSVAALVVEAESGREVARSSVANQQASFGADVLSRIAASVSGSGVELRDLAERSVADALDAAAAIGGVELLRVERIVVAANSAMAALLLGADVTGLAAHPFTPPDTSSPLRADASFLRQLAADATVSLVPPIAAFVGGDALAATVAAGLVDVAAPALLVDLGTNAELMLALPHGLLVASTAAGPAFEGVGVSCGGPAIAGAIDLVQIVGGDVILHAIGEQEPAWFSGAGLVSAITQLVCVGHIAPDGSMVVEGPLAHLFFKDEAGMRGVRLSKPGGADIVLTQLDVRAVQLAKAAVRAGIESLLRCAGICASELDALLVAGAFGAALVPDDLIAIGVLPSNAGSRIRRVGNAALEGAAAIALDARVLGIAEETARDARHLDLAADAAFTEGFVGATYFCPYEA